jgi:hypothetical protein
MQRKQQVGECWVCVIFFACVCVWTPQILQLRLTIPRSSAPFVSCAPCAFLGGSQGGQVCPPPPPSSYVQRSGKHPDFFFWGGCFFFNGLLKIIPVLGIRVLVSMEYLKTLYILYSEW